MRVKFNHVVHDIVSIFIPGAFLFISVLIFIYYYNSEFLNRSYEHFITLASDNTFMFLTLITLVFYILGTLVYFVSKPIKNVAHILYNDKEEGNNLDENVKNTIDSYIFDKINDYFNRNGKIKLKGNIFNIKYYGFAESFLIYKEKDEFLQVYLSKYRMAMNFVLIFMINLFLLFSLFMKIIISSSSYDTFLIIITLIGCLVWLSLYIEHDKNKLIGKILYSCIQNENIKVISYWIIIFFSITILILSIITSQINLGIIIIICLYLMIFAFLQFLNLFKLCGKEISRLIYMELVGKDEYDSLFKD